MSVINFLEKKIFLVFIFYGIKNVSYLWLTECQKRKKNNLLFEEKLGEKMHINISALCYNK